MTKKGKITTPRDFVLFIGSDIIGRGDNYQLGSLLMQKFLHTASGHRSKPVSILLMNNGVKLVTEDSLVIGELRKLEDEGVEILACGTCLSRLELTDKLAVGKTSNMSEITDSLFQAGKVISL